MTFTRWMALIGVMMAVGMAQVMQQTAIRLKAYELGRRQTDTHAVRSDALWVKTQVARLSSPARLVGTLKQRSTTLVAWSELPSSQKSAQLARRDQRSGAAELSD